MLSTPDKKVPHRGEEEVRRYESFGTTWKECGKKMNSSAQQKKVNRRKIPKNGKFTRYQVEVLRPHFNKGEACLVEKSCWCTRNMVSGKDEVWKRTKGGSISLERIRFKSRHNGRPLGNGWRSTVGDGYKGAVGMRPATVNLRPIREEIRTNRKMGGKTLI